MWVFAEDWVNLLLRWSHVVAGIAWIGTSFYFVALDFSLRKSANADILGEAWEVHGGGFYHVQKYLRAPAHLPEHLIWFKWEAYLTWVSGFCLLIVQYYLNASSLLVDPAILPLTSGQAIGISLASLVVGWLVYNGLCRKLALSRPRLLLALVFGLIAVAAYGYTHVFSGRGAFLHLGALMGTMMAANVFMVIIPNQRKITASLLQAQAPDPQLGAMGKQRSLHNTYLTLPVLAMMISSHYGLLTGAQAAWIVALLIVVAGVAARYFLIRHEAGDPLAKIGWVLPLLMVVLGLAIWLTGSSLLHVDWWNFLLRWGHLIAGIAWIGTSFYFVALDFSLRKTAGLPAGVGGEAWEVHGGGFYHVQKYLLAPAKLPAHLIWFKWEAYLTWVSGFTLLVLQYYVLADLYLIDPAVLALTRWQAIGLSVTSLGLGWLVYDLLCRSPLGQKPAWLVAAVFAEILLFALFYTSVFSGRGAFIHAGAMMGTMMAANVFMVIIPNQRKSTAALLKGQVPDVRFGLTGKQRSLHNTFLTLPVLFMMISNHYPMITGNLHPVLLIGLVVMAGALLRHVLIRIEVGQRNKAVVLGAGGLAVLLLVAVFLTQPKALHASAMAVTDAQAQAIVSARCVPCHSAHPRIEGFTEAPKGIDLETLDAIRRYAPQIAAQAVQSETMPLGNMTEMLPEERAQLGQWIAQQ